jgi:hypothetical protein
MYTCILYKHYYNLFVWDVIRNKYCRVRFNRTQVQTRSRPRMYKQKVSTFCIYPVGGIYPSCHPGPLIGPDGSIFLIRGPDSCTSGARANLHIPDP